MEDNIPKYVQEFAETSGTAPDASYVPQFTEDMEAQVAQGLEQKQYSSAPEQAKAFAEGVTQGVAGPLATMAETALFDNEREQRLRREHAGTAHGLGQIGGLLAPMGLGAAAKALGAGEAVAKGVSNFGVGAALSKLGAATEAGIGATTALGRVGSTATRFAVESMAFQALDEVSKEVLHDPRTAESALVNIGLAGVLGGTLGLGTQGTAELWKASGAGNKLAGWMDKFKNRVDAGPVSKEAPNTKFLNEPHVLFSAENPRVNPDLKMSTEEVVDMLQKKGYDAEIVQGHYGSPERSILVKNPTPEEAHDLFNLSKSLGQESSIYSASGKHEMHYHNGEKAGQMQIGEGTEIHTKQPEDFYTKTKEGTTFTHNFDWTATKGANESILSGATLAPETNLIHYSPTQGISKFEPKMQGTRGISQETAAGRQEHPQTDFYLENTTPEQVVMEGAKSKYVSKVGDSKIYNLDKDPEGIYAELKKKSEERPWNKGIVNQDEIRAELVKRGYDGYIRPGIEGHGGKTVAMFNPPKIEKEIPVSLRDRQRTSALEADQLVRPASRPMAPDYALDIPEDIRAALGNNQEARNLMASLRERASSGGDKVRALEQGVKDQAQNKVLNLLGKTPEEVIASSEYDAGKELRGKLIENFDKRHAATLQAYEKFETTFKNAEIPLQARREATNAISQIIADDGLLKSADETSLKLAQKVLEKLPIQSTAADLKNFITNLRNSNPFGSETYQTAKKIIPVIEDLQQAALQEHVQINAPKLLEEYAATKANYRQMKQEIDFLNDRLHSGKAYGAESFKRNINEMAPEDVLKRMNPKGDVDMQRFMEQHMPELVQNIRAQEVNKLIRGALDSKGEINLKKLNNLMEKMSPEFRDFALTKEQQAGIKYLHETIQSIPGRINPSGTARTLDDIMRNGPDGAIGWGAAILKRVPLVGDMLAEGMKLAGREARDATDLATLKLLGSAEATSPAGFKAAIQTYDAALKGEKEVVRAVDNIAQGKSAEIKEPSKAEIDKLKKLVDKAEQDPEHVINATQDVGYYLPEHGAAISSIAARSIEYLSTLKPNTTPVSPLSGPRKISKADEAKYNNALAIAQNPAIILNRIADGSVTKEDLSHMKNLAPGLYERTQQKLFQAVVDSHAKGKILPYKTQIGISKFLEMPMNATMAPAAIQANQIIKAQMQPASMGPAPSGPKNLNKLDKQPGLYQTPQQQRQMFRGSHK